MGKSPFYFVNDCIDFANGYDAKNRDQNYISRYS